MAAVVFSGTFTATFIWLRRAAHMPRTIKKSLPDPAGKKEKGKKMTGFIIYKLTIIAMFIALLLCGGVAVWAIYGKDNSVILPYAIPNTIVVILASAFLLFF